MESNLKVWDQISLSLFDKATFLESGLFEQIITSGILLPRLIVHFRKDSWNRQLEFSSEEDAHLYIRRRYPDAEIGEWMFFSEDVYIGPETLYIGQETLVDDEGFITAHFRKNENELWGQSVGRIRWFCRMPTTYVLQDSIEDSAVERRRHVIARKNVAQMPAGG